MVGSEESEGPEVKLEDQRSNIQTVWNARHVWPLKWDLAKEKVMGGLWKAVLVSVGGTWSYLWSTGSAVWKKRGGEWGQAGPHWHFGMLSLWPSPSKSHGSYSLDQLSTRAIKGRDFSRQFKGVGAGQTSPQGRQWVLAWSGLELRLEVAMQGGRESREGGRRRGRPRARSRCQRSRSWKS